MRPSTSIRPARRALQQLQKRAYSTPIPSKPRHLFSIADLTPLELNTLVLNASSQKSALQSGTIPEAIKDALKYKNIAMMFSKRSTRTRVSTESAITAMGGHSMFLGSQDIQLGVNESLRDTSVIISSMTAGMVARVGKHEEVTGLAEWSSVPVINALSSDFHPLQTIADFLTIFEALGKKSGKGLGVEGLKIAWVGDSNNVLFDLAIACQKLGVHIAVASPEGYGIPAYMRDIIIAASPMGQSLLTETTVPAEAIKNADVLVTDTWISMGQEEESAKRLKAFEGYQITEEMAKKGGANDGWKFMHCLPRHQEEVDDGVFYGRRSLVFHEGQNRLYAAVSALEGFVVRKGEIA
ncbi:mitochondrial putative ornithine carbamoyltransferase [Amylocarpus encephaloides]|uniref:Ornithine carbamoyltransferase, mitochondrial n=1 Tax=Amylocarpus encephaloides TaxID=45428 RepID=A0A9P8CA71_9HELO|nr:mitochondrial putative ornithine carbamoyltransferase [Amylocarpus encephaloides]